MTVHEMFNIYKEEIASLHFFDSNCWIGIPNNPLPIYSNSAKELIDLMDYYGIEKALISHTLARYYHPRAGNNLLLNQISNNNRLLGCFILLPPATEELEPVESYIDKMIKNKVYAARIFPNYHNFSTSSWSIGILLDKLEERRIPLFIWSREISWDSMYTLAQDHPKLPIILEFCDTEVYWNTRFIFSLLESCRNIFIESHKTHLYREIDEIVERFGAQRVVFSTYIPIDDPNSSLMLVTNGYFTRKEKEMIAHGNLEKLIADVIR
jgi:uncharacterized protein